MTKSEVLRIAQQERVQFLRMQFTDILGQIKNVEIPSPQFSIALDSQVLFDGSSIEGFSRTKELDMILVPDYNSFRVFPWSEDKGENKIASIICDIHYPDGREFEGCPRLALKRIVNACRKLELDYQAGSEVEFFLFRRKSDGSATLSTHDSAGYFDLTPDDVGEATRRNIVKALETMNFKVESSHHEVAQGQHEIDFIRVDAVTAADYISSCKFVVRKIAGEFGLHATFMPKPQFNQYGSGLHLHQVLTKDGKNMFYDPGNKFKLSDTALHFIGGQLEHAMGYCAITNPLINSYKRLVPGSEAPIFVSWAEQNVSPLLRVPDQREENTRVELRLPDPTCNPYLALAAVLQAGLDGIKHHINPGLPVNKDVFLMSQRGRSRLKVSRLPKDLNEALIQLKKDKIIHAAIGDYIYNHFITAKQAEWNSYISQIHPWEIEHYFTYY
ncbi:glutamine synthetase [bacterium SM23_31]|nr:MAG: glutamine synthetase [bacterium SM23_31]